MVTFSGRARERDGSGSRWRNQKEDQKQSNAKEEWRNQYQCT